MTFQHPDLVINTIWRDVEEAEEDCNAFAILDGARAPGIHDHMLKSDIKQRCLYSGEIPEALAEVAPYLVQLDRDDPATRLLIHNCWGKSWGIFFTSTAYLEGLHRHFRRFLKVRDEDYKSLYFRYYDPRVLRTYLPTCDRSELLFVFGPVRSFFVEDEDPDNLLEFTIKDEKFITYRRPVVPPPVEEQEAPLVDMPPEEDTLVLPPVDLALDAAMPPRVVLPPPMKAEDLAGADEQQHPAADPSSKEFLLPARNVPAQLADMPLGDPLGEETLLMPTDELLVGSQGGEDSGDPEDPESR